MAFTMALKALEQGHNTMVLLMVEAVELGQREATDGIDVGQPFEPVSDLLAKFVRGGGRIGICKSCMIHNGFTEAQMAPGDEIMSVPEIIDLMIGYQRFVADHLTASHLLRFVCGLS